MRGSSDLLPLAARADIVEGLQRGLLAGIAVLVIVLPPQLGSSHAAAVARVAPSSLASLRVAPAQAPARYADVGTEPVSLDARHVADWVADSRDNGGAAFVIVDKKAATVHVFDAEARLRASTPVLLGYAAGDDSVAGIGTRPIAEVRPEERTTPAGRFVGERGRNALGEDVVWVDYAAAVSMHRVRTTNAAEHRLERLATPTIDDNRISYGCINVPVAFFETYIRPVFAAQRAIVYVLPETRSAQQVFGSYDVAAAHGYAEPVERRRAMPPF
jgi:hypothetical protein